MCYSFLATIMSDHTSWLLLFVPDSLENLKSRVTRKKGRGFGGMHMLEAFITHGCSLIGIYTLSAHRCRCWFPRPV